MTIETKNFRSPSYFSNTANNQLNIHQNLTGQDMMNVALNSNYIAMNGHYQISLAETAFGVNEIVSTAVQSYRFITFINANMNERYWTVQAWSNDTNIVDVNIGINANTYSSASAGKISKPNQGGTYGIIAQSLNYTGSSYVKEDTTMTVTTSYSPGSAPAGETEINSISMYVPPHVYINPTLTLGQQAVDIESMKPNKPIFSTPTKQISSIAGIAANIQYTKENVIPTKNIFSVTAPYQITAGLTNWGNGEIDAFSTAKVTKYAMAYGTAMDLTQSYKTVNWYAAVAVQDAAQPGRLELSSSYQVTGVNFNNTSPAWISGTLIVPTENLSFDSGFNPATVSGASGSLTYSIKKTVSTGPQFASMWTLQLFEGTEL